MKTKWRIFLAVAPLWAALDQLTKHWVVERFQLGESLPVLPGIFNLTYIRNPGVAFGFLGDLDPAIRVPLLILAPLIALASIVYVLHLLAEQELRMATALSLISGGAVGNLIDRIQLGYVVDSLDFHWQGKYHYPAFNLADVGICVGVGLILLDSFRREKSCEKALQPAGEASTLEG